MKSKFTSEEKKSIVAQYWDGRPAVVLCAEYGIPRSTLYSWLKPYKALQSAEQSPATQKEYADLRRHAEKQAKILEVIQQSGCAPSSPLEDRLSAFKKYKEQYSAHILCEALNISRGTYYNRILHDKAATVFLTHQQEIKNMVLSVFEESEQRYGADKILAVLTQRGVHTSKKLILKIMREEGLQSIGVHAKKDYKAFSKKQNAVQGLFHADAPNMVWVSDVTVFKVKEKYLYVCVILDLFSRKVVSFHISPRNSTQLITTTFKMAFEERGGPVGLTFHSDQGAQYTATAFRRLLLDCGVTQSFSGRGRPTDNAVAEAFFSFMKREELYRRNYRSEKEFRESVASYIKFYNEDRPHRYNSYRSPCQAEAAL